MIKYFKLKAVHYRDLERLLKDAGLVIGKSGFPLNIFVCNQDYKKMQKALTKVAKQWRPYLKGNALKSTVGNYMLCLAPCINPAVREGYAVFISLTKEERGND